ncbi:hypothetical protein HZA97_02650 [Candidatus Woesearchaeota archaeon]|nr:hypothetical protein [Candidatus Woesearchaeota archaeon]
MKTQTCSIKLTASPGKNLPGYNMIGQVLNGKVDLNITTDKGEQIGTAKGDLGPTGNFYITTYLKNSKYKKISAYATVEKEIMQSGGITIDEKIQQCFLEGIVGEDVYIEFTLLSIEGLYGLTIEGKINYQK